MTANRKLRKLGEVIGISSQRNLIVKVQSSRIPKINSKVFDKRKRVVGFVFDIIGPVESPYAVVKPEVYHEEMKGKILYVWR